MAKTDKELAVELAIAIINANPRATYTKTAGGIENLAPSLSAEAIDNLIKHYYKLLKELER